MDLRLACFQEERTPFFKRIAIGEWNIEWDGIRGVANIKEAKLEEKH